MSRYTGRYLLKSKNAFGYRRYTKNVHRMEKGIIGEEPFQAMAKLCRIKYGSDLWNLFWLLRQEYITTISQQAGK